MILHCSASIIVLLHLLTLVYQCFFIVRCDNSYLIKMYFKSFNKKNFFVDNNSTVFTQYTDESAVRSVEKFNLEENSRLKRATSYMFHTRDYDLASMYSNDTELHILHKLKKIKKWNTYHRNRFKRTTVHNPSDEFQTSLWATPTTLNDSPVKKRHDRTNQNSSNFFLNTKWPVKRVVSVEGDVLIGALMMVHSRGADGKLCGPIMPQGGVQALEVMLYTLREINKKMNMPFQIGAHILDDCDTDTYGLEMALDFIKANLHYLDEDPNKSECSKVSKPIWGVVGAPSSITSIQVSNLLRLFKIPMISPFSTSPELSNKNKFDYFCRTIPSDYYQVQVIARIIQELKWTYVSIIYEESNYGIKGLEELEKVLSELKVCIAIKEKVLKDSGVPNETFFDNVVTNLLTKPLAVGVIVFASDQEVAGIMRAVKRRNITHHFSWIGSDGWSARNLVSEGNEDVVEGTISVQPRANSVKGFAEYFFSLNPFNVLNPYFAEYWETVFQCRLPHVPDTPFNTRYNKSCDSNLQLEPQKIELENQLQFVHQATYGFCQALINMHADLCGPSHIGICEQMWRSRGAPFLNYIKKVNFTDFSGDEFQFDPNGDGPARYNIVHYKLTAKNSYKWVRVGRFANGNFSLNVSELQFKWNQTEIPVSACSRKCEKGEVKKYINGDKCCWKCVRCSKYEVVLPADETECKECVFGTKPDEDRKSCIEVNDVLRHSDFFLFSVTCTTGFGFFNVSIIFIIYAYNFNSPIVKASSREAQILVLTGAWVLHVNAYSFLLDPDELVCCMQSYLSGIGYILIYGTLFWKSYRIVRIFDMSSQYKNLNSSAFILLVLGLCSIQKIVSVVWTYFLDPRKVTFVYPNRDTKIKLCSAFKTVEMSYFVAYIFPLICIVFCYFRTKKITNTPKIFDDSPQIFFCIRFTIISWIAMFIIHFTTSNILFRQNILALITNLNGCVAVFALFYRSLIIILFRPHMNTREYLRASRANFTMKSLGNEDSHTKENFSQCMMEDFSADYQERSSPVLKRDVSIQYSSSSNTNEDTCCGDMFTHLPQSTNQNASKKIKSDQLNINDCREDSSSKSVLVELDKSYHVRNIGKFSSNVSEKKKENYMPINNMLKNRFDVTREEIYEIIIKENAHNDELESGCSCRNISLKDDSEKMYSYFKVITGIGEVDKKMEFKRLSISYGAKGEISELREDNSYSTETAV